MSDESEKPVPVPVEESPESPSIQTASNEKNTPNPTTPTPSERHPPDTQNSQSHEKNLTNWDIFERIIRIAEFIAFIAAILTAIFIGYQWHEMVKASKIAGKQLDAMQGQLNVMQAQLEEMRKSREVDERAWIFATGDVTQTISEKNDSFVFFVSYKNTGKTPALHFQTVIYWTNIRRLIPQKDGYPSAVEREGLCAPEQVLQLTTTPIPAQVVEDTSNGTSFFIYGTIWYDDIFGDHHWSQFCLEAVRDMMNKNIIRFRTLHVHNSCDDAQSDKSQ